MTTPLEQIKERIRGLRRTEAYSDASQEFRLIGWNEAVKKVEELLPSIIQEVEDNIICDNCHHRARYKRSTSLKETNK